MTFPDPLPLPLSYPSGHHVSVVGLGNVFTVDVLYVWVHMHVQRKTEANKEEGTMEWKRSQDTKVPVTDSPGWAKAL